MTFTAPEASSTVSATVATVYVFDVSPAANDSVFEPSLAEATKSLPETSATVSAMDRPSDGAATDRAPPSPP